MSEGSALKTSDLREYEGGKKATGSSVLCAFTLFNILFFFLLHLNLSSFGTGTASHSSLTF